MIWVLEQPAQLVWGKMCWRVKGAVMADGKDTLMVSRPSRRVLGLSTSFIVQGYLAHKKLPS